MSSSLAFRLRRAAARLAGERVALGTLADAHGPAARGTLLVLTALPCMLPVPGTGTVLGVGLALLALAMWRGHDIGRLPERVAAFQMPRPLAQRVLRLAATFYATAGRWSRARWQPLLRPGWVAPFIALMALLIVLPIPFGNLLPAMAVVLLGVGLAFRDGLALAAGAATGALGLAFAAGLAVGTWMLGQQWLA